MDLLEKIPSIFFQFIIVLIFSLLIGLEQRRHQGEKDTATIPFGTDRTFTFIGVLGFLLYILDPHNFILFIVGAILPGVLFAIYYYKKIQTYNAFGITSILVGLIAYSLGPILITQPRWLTVLIIVSILILVESKPFFIKFSGSLTNNEFITLGKFLIISGVILPILPTEPISDTFNISPYQIWLSLVVVSGISYAGYLLKKFVFKKSGVIVSGILGGLYSSTATTIILSKKSKSYPESAVSYGAAIILANGMMYLRIFILMLIFNFELGVFTMPYILIMIMISLITGGGIYFMKGKVGNLKAADVEEKNPLELRIAIIFAALFIFFSFLTNYTLKVYGESGLNFLSFVLGFTDIDPFLLNLFQGKFQISNGLIATAAFKAMISNNILKIIASSVLADKTTKKIVIIGLGAITILNFILIFFIPD